jgi:Amt family ammonium transporter
LVGICTGAVAGLVVITPAAGYVEIGGAMAMGVLVSLASFYMVAYIKPKMGYDDALDAFGVHGIGGFLGALLTGVFASPWVQEGYSGALFGNWHQLGVQLIASIATLLYSGIGSFLLYKLADKWLGVRAAFTEEAIGLDETQHGESAYTTFD